MKPIRNNFLTLKFPALLAFVLLAMAPRGFGDDTPAPGKPPLTDDQFRKITDALDANAVAQPFSSRITAVLGLTQGDAALNVRVNPVKDRDGAFHFIVKLDGDAGYIIGYSNSKIAYDFRVDKNRLLVSAASSSPAGIMLVPNKDAQKLLDAELGFWSAAAGKLK